MGDLPGANVKSYSGYLTVNKEYNSNLFFWFFPALAVRFPTGLTSINHDNVLQLMRGTQGQGL